jgi:hypothetical protein
LGEDAIANLSITNAKIADATIQSAKIANLDAGKITSGTINTQTLSIKTDYYSFTVANEYDEEEGEYVYGLKMYTGTDPEDIYAANLSLLGSEATLQAGYNVSVGSRRGALTLFSGGFEVVLADYAMDVSGTIMENGTALSNKYSKLLTVVSKSSSISVGKNSTANSSFSVSKSGYTPLGIVGWQFPSTNSSFMFLPRLYISGDTCNWLARNTSGNDYSGTLTVDVLYVKN